LIEQRIVEKDKTNPSQVANRFMTVLRSSLSDCIGFVESARSALKKRIPKLSTGARLSRIKLLSPALKNHVNFPDSLRLKQRGAVVLPYSFLPSSVG
jgi:hypothetical protein